MKCECDGHEVCEGDIKMRKAMTSYHYEGVLNGPGDPNRDKVQCVSIIGKDIPSSGKPNGLNIDRVKAYD